MTTTQPLVDLRSANQLRQAIFQAQPVALNHRVSGRALGEGPHLVLVHGIGSWLQAWDLLLPWLEQRFCVITLDLRSHASSPMSPQPDFGLEHLVADLEALRAHLGIERWAVAGHSLGGMIGPAYALAFPDRCQGVGLLSTAAFRTDDDSAKVWALVNRMEGEGIAPVLETLKARWFTEDFAAQNPDVVAQRMQRVLATDPASFLQVFRIYAGTEMSPWLGEVAAPCLVLTGEEDGGCNPRLNQQIHQALPHSNLMILPKLRHNILLESPQAMAEALIDAFAS